MINTQVIKIKTHNFIEDCRLKIEETNIMVNLQ